MDRNDHSQIKTLATLIVILVLLVIAYIYYRYQENPTQAQITNITNLAALPSSKCSFSTGNFVGASAGTIYISGGKLREDLQVVQGGESRLLHLILTDDGGGTAYSWLDGDTTGTIISGVYSSGQSLIAADNISCAPWWRTNAAAFQLPNVVTFAAAQ